MTVACGVALGCGSDGVTATGPEMQPLRANSDVADASGASLAREVRLLAASHGIGLLPAPPRVRGELVALGRALAFDPILSGNRNIACMTCHLPDFATSDGRRLGLGEGGVGMGPMRRPGTPTSGLLIPRNSPPAFNLAALRVMFWDGRVSVDAGGHYHTPAGAQLTPAMTSAMHFGAASAQAMFPVTSRAEMRGSQATASRTNEIVALADNDFAGVWVALMKRLGAIPAYRRLFEAAYPGMRFEDMTFAHASNAIAGFFIARLSFDNSPWDRFLGRDDRALSAGELRGAKAFMGNCASCHNGPAFTDEQFHNVALAQFGPGKGNGPLGRDDYGRMNVSGSAADRYAFRTAPLRNVELTAPYGHAGQFTRLHEFVAHYSGVDANLLTYDARQLDPTLQATMTDNAADVLATRDPALKGLVLTPQQIDDITAYLGTLTDPAARHLHELTPAHVPSGLPVNGERAKVGREDDR